MNTTDVLAWVDDLEWNIDDLEESLEPLFVAALSETTGKLPLLDRAKLYTVLVYSIESLIFSYLRLNGVRAKEHAVFQELGRVKQYFEKIKLAEEGQNPAKPNVSLNKQATGRFIKQALAGNDRFDTERAEREAKEKLLAARKARNVSLNVPENPVPLVEASVPSEQKGDLEDGEVDEDDSEMLDAPTAEKAPIAEPGTSSEQKKAHKRRERKRMKRAKLDGNVGKPKKEKKKKRSKSSGFRGDEEQELVKPG